MNAVQRALAQQLVADILFGEAGGGQRAVVFVFGVKVAPAEIGQRGVDAGGVRRHVMGGLDLRLHELMLHQAVRHGAPRGRAEIGARAAQESGEANLAVQVAGGDDAVADRDRDAVDDFGGQREGGEQDAETQRRREQNHLFSSASLRLCVKAFQNVCPMEKKN